MNDEAAFIQVIAENPYDHNLPLIFADWLEENDDERAPWVRDRNVRAWMGPNFENPLPALLEAVRARKKVMSARSALASIGAPAVPDLVKLLDHEHDMVRLYTLRCFRNMGPEGKEAVPQIIQRLKDEDWSVREAAAKALLDIGVEKGTDVTLLQEALTDENYSVRDVASRILGKMKAKTNVADDITEKLGDSSPRVRQEAVAALGELKTKDVLEPICEALKDPSADVRVEAILALVKLKTRDKVLPMLQALEDRSSVVRQTAISQLSYVLEPGMTEALAPLRKALRDKSEEVRADALRGLGKLEADAEPAIPDILRLATSKASRIRWSVANVLGDIKIYTPEALKALEEMVQDEDQSVADTALRALTQGPKLPVSMAPALIAHYRQLDQEVWWSGWVLEAMGNLEEPTPEVLTILREELVTEGGVNDSVARALASFGDRAKAVIPELVAQVEQGDSYYYSRSSCASALAKMGPEGLTALSNLLSSKSDRIRSHVLHAIGEAGKEALFLLPTLRERLRKSKSDTFRSELIRTIGEMGPDAAEAIPDLLKAWQSKDQNVVYSAREVLPKFGSALVEYLSEVEKVLKKKPELRLSAGHLLAKLAEHTPDVLPLLRLCLQEALPKEGENWNEQWTRRDASQQALGGLAVLGEQAAEAVPDVVPHLESRFDDVRREAAITLGILRSADAVPALKKAIWDLDENVRLRIVEALGLIGPEAEDAVNELVDALDDKVPRVRRESAIALGLIGVKTDKVINALTKATQDSNKQTAAKAKSALKKIERANK